MKALFALAGLLVASSVVAEVLVSSKDIAVQKNTTSKVVYMDDLWSYYRNPELTVCAMKYEGRPYDREIKKGMKFELQRVEERERPTEIREITEEEMKFVINTYSVYNTPAFYSVVATLNEYNKAGLRKIMDQMYIQGFKGVVAVRHFNLLSDKVSSGFLALTCITDLNVLSQDQVSLKKYPGVSVRDLADKMGLAAEVGEIERASYPLFVPNKKM